MTMFGKPGSVGVCGFLCFTLLFCFLAIVGVKTVFDDWLGSLSLHASFFVAFAILRSLCIALWLPLFCC